MSNREFGDGCLANLIAIVMAVIQWAVVIGGVVLVIAAVKSCAD